MREFLRAFLLKFIEREDNRDADKCAIMSARKHEINHKRTHHIASFVDILSAPKTKCKEGIC